ncbi:MAG: NAD-dependent epimerase/dehydratase family protein [Tepidisphaeraceae bacterium]
MRILLCGHHSFASQGLVPLLRNAGHEVVCFNRGPISGNEAGVVTGPVDQIHENSRLRRQFDTIINYILLKDEAILSNVTFARSLLTLCRSSGARHLIHISSVSSYKASVKLVHELAEVEDVPERKGSYGSLKTATDQVIEREVPPGVKLTLVRPGFVLGPGLSSPIIGTAARLPWNRLLIIGNARSHIPVIARSLLNEAVAKLASTPPTSDDVEVALLVSPNSPTRKQFIETCCRRLGAGEGVTTLPVPIWYAAAVGAEVAARVLGQGKLQPFNKLVARLPEQRFDPSKTQQRLGLDLTTAWEDALVESLDGQGANFAMPAEPPLPPQIGGRSVTFLGFGRIVKQRHLPALKKYGSPAEVRAYDLKASTVGEVPVRAIGESRIEPSDLFVVATPGPAHIRAIDSLDAADGAVLIEKPLCYTREELARWTTFAAARRQPVFVCHNYRMKLNVIRMIRHLRQYNPGRLRHASVHFRSPPVSFDGAAWLRKERAARTLLMDYALHFVDLACMFGDAWRVDHVRHELNSLGQTELIEGHVTADYSVNFLLRQGFGPRRARVVYEFQNYSVALGFFPDTFVPYMADDNPWLYKREARASRRATFQKVADKMLSRDSDPSHGIMLAGAITQGGARYVEQLRVDRLRPFYDMLFEVGDRVYG